MKPAALTEDEQTAILAERYSQRAEAYDMLWSPVIRPVGERLIRQLPLKAASSIIDVGTGAGALLPAIRRAAPDATLLGVDRSEGMLRLARDKHAGSLALMDAQKLSLLSNRFDAAIVAFVLFHVPSPERCLSEVNRVLKPGGTVGTVTWGAERTPMANAIWDEELAAAGAHFLELPATDNRACCDNGEKVTALFEQAGFIVTRVWSESMSIAGGLKTTSTTRCAVLLDCGFCPWTTATGRLVSAGFANAYLAQLMSNTSTAPRWSWQLPAKLMLADSH